jgi:hypothetical protein
MFGSLINSKFYNRWYEIDSAFSPFVLPFSFGFIGVGFGRARLGWAAGLDRQFFPFRVRCLQSSDAVAWFLGF